MSLITDIFFYNALKGNDDIMEATEGRIFNTTRNEEDETEDRIPYIIITFDGMTNGSGTKDDIGESDTDTDTISVLIVANNREELADLMEVIRPAIKDAAKEQDPEEDGFDLTDYTLSASAVDCDITRPCHFQTLIYSCETKSV